MLDWLEAYTKIGHRIKKVDDDQVIHLSKIYVCLKATSIQVPISSFPLL